MADIVDALKREDAVAVARVLEARPELRARLNDPMPGGAFGQTALLFAVERANRDLVDVLLRAGADINQKSHWWAGGFHVLDGASREPWLPSFLIGRGATLEIHHAVQLGMADEVRRLLAEDPALVHARGGDGQLPLHFAQTVDMAEYLLSRGADIDARDVDHESTAAQYMVRDRQAVARYLVARGCQTDVLMAAALGDVELTRHLLDGQPDAIRSTVSAEWFPMRDSRAGGTIYIWTLGAGKGAHEIAREFDHEDVVRLLMDRSPDLLKLAVACELGDEPAVREALSRRGGHAAIPDDERPRLAAAARNNKTLTVRLLLDAGWPAAAHGGQHDATALHWAGFHGNLDMTRTLLAHGAPVSLKDRDFHATPVGWVTHGSLHGWHCRTGDYAGTLEALLDAGAEPPDGPVDASEAVLDVLGRRGRA